jgi:hypothetical protein
MASMATAQPLMSGPLVSVGSRSRRTASMLWIAVSVAGSVAGALAAWQVRSLYEHGPAILHDDLGYIATVVNALIFSGGQWFVLQRHKLDVAWWVPATVVGNLLNAMVVIPSTLHLFVNSTTIGPTSLETAVVAGAAALGAAGLVVGGAQAMVLRASRGNVVWVWVLATAVGGALSGAITTALSAQLFGLTAVVTISLVATVGAFLTAACQAPVFLRLSR